MSGPNAVRVTLLAHAATAAMRAGRFPQPDDPLDETARENLGRLSLRLNPRCRCRTSPARRAVETAAALGLDAQPEPLLDDGNAGRWAGLSITEVEAVEPDNLAAWFGSPEAAPHSGETQEAVAARVARWLDAQGDGPGVVAVTHATVIRAAVALVLRAPLATMGRIDIAPLSLTRLSGVPGRWRLACLNLPLARRR